METRRVTALISLGLVSAVVVGLIATAGSDAATEAATEATVSAAQQPAGAPAGDVLAEPASDATPAPVQAAPETASATTLDPNTPDLPDRGQHPEFLEVQEWIQTNATTFDDFDGKVLAVQFWTFGCHNCQATFPHMRDLHEKYAGEDFEVIGVHAPEFDFERDVNSVASEAQENGLVWPIAIDNDKLNFRSWQDRRFWPRLFLIDSDGNVRYDHIGEGAYDEIDAAVGVLINEKNA
jgi:thiol-disulfide isomerase/thioredoxin